MNASSSATTGSDAAAAPSGRPRVGEAGQLNAADYRARALEKVAQYPELSEFADQLERSLPGTNVDAHKICHYDKAAQVLHRRALFIADADGDDVAGLAAFAAGDWSARRQAFEDLWHNGRQFVYGAPNPETLGAQKYGAYCLILDPTE